MARIQQAAGRALISAFRRRRRTDIDGVAHVRLRAPKLPSEPPSTALLPAGSVHGKGALPLPVDIHVDRDIPVRLRDGVYIHVDVYRPPGDEPVPAVVAWSPYGKRNPMTNLVNIPGLRLSNLQKFEAPDPAVWVPRGYAVVNPDLRGTQHSGGHFVQWGRQEGRDGHDLVEWLAAQPWSNGKVGLAGNSWLAISQWFIAAEQPPHLAAIAPWEGFADFYRHSVAPGGVPITEFATMAYILMLRGLELAEDTVTMLDRQPLLTPFWRDKAADLAKVTVPAYVVSSYANKVHTRGTIHAFNAIASQEKWLRIHNSHEWPDFYAQHDDLFRFFDHYLKGEDNGWETTPRVRMAVLDPGGTDTVDRPEAQFPPEGVEPRDLYLDLATSRMEPTPPPGERAIVMPAGDGRSAVAFTHRFREDTEIAGFPVLHLWAGVEDADDAEIFLEARKLDAAGNEQPVVVHGAPTSGTHGAPYQWGNGMIRLALRRLDEERSAATGLPVLALDTEQRLRPGDVVPVAIEIPPMAMRFRAGEQLQLAVAGYDRQDPELPVQPRRRCRNRGGLVLHTGGRYAARLTLPIHP